MKNMFLKFLVLSFIIICVAGCNATTRQLGGEQTIELQENKKLVNVTWKENDLWILTRNMRDEDIAESYEFQEDSNFGVLEGTVIIKENKK
jgi:hypothetical protein